MWMLWKSSKNDYIPRNSIWVVRLEWNYLEPSKWRSARVKQKIKQINIRIVVCDKVLQLYESMNEAH